MGLQLKASLKEKIFMIGSSSDSKTTSMDLALSQLRIPRFFLNLRPSGDPAAGVWLAKPHTLLTNSNSFLTLTPATAFDAIVFVDRLTPSQISAR
jgi:hypothetical protein